MRGMKNMIVYIIIFSTLTVLAAALFLLRPAAAQGGDFTPEITRIMIDARALGEQSVTMPINIFQLAAALADQPDKDEALRAAVLIYDGDSSPTGFARRVGITALRFIGPYPFGPDSRTAADALILRGLGDSAVWVRYDAAWVAGITPPADPAVSARIAQMQRDLAGHIPEPGSAEEKLKEKIDAFMATAAP